MRRTLIRPCGEWRIQGETLVLELGTKRAFSYRSIPLLSLRHGHMHVMRDGARTG